MKLVFIGLLILLSFVQVQAKARWPSWTKVDFSVKRGFYDKPFELAMINPFPGGSIRYTIQAFDQAPTEPSQTAGTAYTGPFTISRTSIVKAFGWSGNLKTNVTVHSYLFPSDIINQNTLNRNIINNPAYKTSLVAGLKSFPSVSVTSMTGYPNWVDKTRPYFKVSLEWIDPDTGKDWRVSAGAEIYGGYSVNYEKKNLRFHFQEQFGDGELDEAVFDGYDWGVGTTKSFKSLNFRSHSQDGIFGEVWGWFPLTWMKNIWHDWFFQDVGHVAPHARYAHVYWNGRYQGIHHVRERMGSHFFKEYFGGERDDYCGISKGRVFDGNVLGCPWATIRATPRWDTIRGWLDINSFLDYCIVTHYGGNADLAYEHNWQAGGPIHKAPFLGKDSGFKFFLSDQDATFWQGDVYRDITGGNFLSNTFNGLIAEKHPEFMMRFQDRIWRHLVSPRGHLLPSAVRERFDRIINKFRMNSTMIVELARWGHLGSGGVNRPFDLPEWKRGLDVLFSYYIPIRTGITVKQYKDRNWMSTLGAPSFTLYDDYLYPNGTKCTMSYLVGSKIYYTTDASDPRAYGGAVNTFAKQAVAPFTWKLYETTTIWSRVLQGSVWGPLEKMTFRIDPGYCYLCGKVVISEIHYNPVIGRSGFIEIKNIAKVPINMNGCYFQGLRYTFPPIILPPGGFWVIADTWEGFKKVYGRYPDDHSWLTLDQSDAVITLRDSAKRRVCTVEYGSRRPWSELPDGYGYSLVPATNYTDIADDDPPTSPKNWRASAFKNGSPWKDDPASTLPPIRLQVNEIMTNAPTGNNWVEFSNPTTSPVDVSGWAIIDAYRDGNSFEFPKGTIIPAGATKVLPTATLGFPFDKLGGKVVLFQAQCCRDDRVTPLNTGVYREYEYGAAIPGYPLGWYKTSNGQMKWGRLQSATSGLITNSAPYRSAVVISAIVPSIPWVNLNYRGLEYVRITNYGETPVDLTSWYFQVGKRWINLSGSLGIRQNGYILLTSNVAQFQKAWGFDRRDKNARYFQPPINLTSFEHWCSIHRWFPSLNKTLNVDEVDGSMFSTMKRQIVNQSDVPTEFIRQLDVPYDSVDPKSWKSSIGLPPPFDCLWKLWTDWTACSVTCGDGIQTRKRDWIPELYGGVACQGPKQETMNCTKPPCPIDCTWTEWAEWDQCPVTCGGGTTMTTRVMTPAKYGGKPCDGPSWQFSDCNTNPCPIDCVWSEWTEWGSCSASCGEGEMQRTRYVAKPSQYDGLCFGNKTDVASCNVTTCYPPWAIALLAMAGVIGLLLLFALLSACFGAKAPSPSGAEGYSVM